MPPAFDSQKELDRHDGRQEIRLQQLQSLSLLRFSLGTLAALRRSSARPHSATGERPPSQAAFRFASFRNLCSNIRVIIFSDSKTPWHLLADASKDGT